MRGNLNAIEGSDVAPLNYTPGKPTRMSPSKEHRDARCSRPRKFLASVEPQSPSTKYRAQRCGHRS